MNLGDMSILASIIAGLIAIPFAASNIAVGDDYKYGLSAILNKTPDFISDISEDMPGFSSKTISDDLIEYVYQTPNGKFIIRMSDGRFETILTNIGRKVSSVQSPDGQIWMLLLPAESLVINQTNQRVSEMYKNLDGYIEVVMDSGSVYTTTRGTASEAELQQGMLKLESDLNYSIALMKNMTEYILNATPIPPSTPNVTIIINEFESNPEGTDAGNEWIEFYNPTAETINMTGWKIYNKNLDAKDIPFNTTIEPNGYYVLNTTGLNLYNSDEQLTLKNNTIIIDATPKKSDSSNNNYCWARVPNGQDTNSDSDWKFWICTKGSWNG